MQMLKLIFFQQKFVNRDKFSCSNEEEEAETSVPLTDVYGNEGSSRTKKENNKKSKIKSKEIDEDSYYSYDESTDEEQRKDIQNLKLKYKNK